MRKALTALVAGVILASCSTPGAQTPAASVPVQQTQVLVDPRIELMSVLQVLTDYPLTTYLDLPYKKEVRDRFGPHATHPAATTFQAMWKKEFRFSSVPEAAMAYTPPPELALRRSVSDEVLSSSGGAAQLAQLIAHMRDFANVTDFNSFLASKQPFYAQLVAKTLPIVESVVAPLESYLGTPLGDTTVILGPLLHDGGFLASYNSNRGNPEIFAIIGPERIENGMPDFGAAERLEPLLTHEFAHSVINPLTDRHSAEVTAKAALFPPLAAKMKENGYDTWNQTVYEHVIRAITVRLTTLSRGEAAGKAAMDEEVKRGFVYVPPLVQKLIVYEGNREQYRTIREFYPELLAALG